MDDSVRVRRADVDDAAAIAPFHLRCWHEAYAGFVPRTALDQLDAQDRVGHWRRRLQRQGDTTVLAVDDGVVVGLATAGPSGHHRPRPPVVLRSLYVGAAHQGRGIGSALVGAVLGEQEASLWVFVDNARARRFYVRTGWRPSGRRCTDAFTGADEVEMVRGGPTADVAALPPAEFAFPGPLRDRLVTAILDGTKTSTTSLLAEYEREGEPLPAVGDRSALLDSAGARVAVLEVTGVRVTALGEVDLDHARDEGEGEGEGHDSVAAWRADHERFFHGPEMRAALGDAGFTTDDATRVVLERFRVVEHLEP